MIFQIWCKRTCKSRRYFAIVEITKRAKPASINLKRVVICRVPSVIYEVKGHIFNKKVWLREHKASRKSFRRIDPEQIGLYINHCWQCSIQLIIFSAPLNSLYHCMFPAFYTSSDASPLASDCSIMDSYQPSGRDLCQNPTWHLFTCKIWLNHEITHYKKCLLTLLIQ